MEFTAPLDTDDAEIHNDTPSTPPSASEASSETSGNTSSSAHRGKEAEPIPLPATFTQLLKSNLISNLADSVPDHTDQTFSLRDATRPFFGGLNNHSAAAKDRMRGLRIGKLKESE